MLLSEDMVNLERDGRQRRGKPAVFASRTCTVPNERREGRIVHPRLIVGVELQPQERTRGFGREVTAFRLELNRT
jgi:hypothetical protein